MLWPIYSTEEEQSGQRDTRRYYTGLSIQFTLSAPLQELKWPGLKNWLHGGGYKCLKEWMMHTSVVEKSSGRKIERKQYVVLIE